MNKIYKYKERIAILINSAEGILFPEKIANIQSQIPNYFNEFKSESDANLRKIQTDHILSNENFYSSFTCVVCTEFNDDYNCCVKCCKTCCNNCIKKSNNKCPYCRQEPFNTRKLTLLEKSFMNFLEIECPYNCGKILKYDRYYGHFDECVNIIKTFKCSNCEILLKAKESDKSNLNNHLKFCIRSCKNCDLKYPLIDFDRHVEGCNDRILVNLEKFVDWSKKNEGNYKIENLKNLIRDISDIK